MTTRRLSQNAAQFCEEVSQDEIVEALKSVTRCAKLKRAYVVTVFPGKRLRGFASARRYTYARNVDVWTPRQIELASSPGTEPKFLLCLQ